MNKIYPVDNKTLDNLVAENTIDIDYGNGEEEFNKVKEYNTELYNINTPVLKPL